MGCATTTKLRKAELQLNKLIKKASEAGATASTKNDGKIAKAKLKQVHDAQKMVKQRAYYDALGITLKEVALSIEDDFDAEYLANPEYVKLQKELSDVESRLAASINKVVKNRFYSSDSKFGGIKGNYKDNDSTAEWAIGLNIELEERIETLKVQVDKQENALVVFDNMLSNSSKLSETALEEISAKRDKTAASIETKTAKITELEGYMEFNEGRAVQASKNDTTSKKLAEAKDVAKLAYSQKLQEIEDYKASKTAGADALNKAKGKHGSRLSDFIKPRVVFNHLKKYVGNITEGFKDLYSSEMATEDLKDLKITETLLSNMVGHVDSAVSEFMNKEMKVIDVAKAAKGEGYQSVSQLLLTDGKLSEEVSTAIAVMTVQWMTDSSDLRASHRNESAIRSLLGKSPSASISNMEREAIADVDMLSTQAANMLGASISKLLGWSVNTDATAVQNKDADLKKRKLDNELGLIGLHALKKAELVKLKKRSSDKIFLDKKSSNNMDPIPLTFVQFTSKANSFFDSKNNIAGKSARFLSAIFNTERTKKEPRGAKARTKVFKNKSGIQNKHTTVNPTIQKGINKATNVEWEWKDDFVGDIFQLLDTEGGRERLEKMLGYVDPDTKHVRYAKALTSENNRVKREITQLEAARSASIRKGEPAIFFDYFYGKNGRLYVDSSTFNPQLSKLHLLAISSKSSAVESERDMNMYDSAMAATFGIKTDKLLLDSKDGILAKWATTEAKLEEIGIEFMPLDEALDAIDMYNSKVDKADKIGGYGAMLIGGIVEYRKYAAAKRENGDTMGVVPTIIMEVDGVTNGYVLKSLQMPLLDDMVKVLQAGGVFVGKRVGTEPELTGSQEFVPDKEGTGGVVFEYSSTAQQIVDPNTKDAYEEPAEDVDNLFKQVFKKGNKQDDSLKRAAELAIGATNGSLDGDSAAKIPNITREFMKPPFMTFNYGAGMAGILQDMADTTIDSFYGLLEELHATQQFPDGATMDERKKMIARGEVLTKQVEDLVKSSQVGWVFEDNAWKMDEAIIADGNVAMVIDDLRKAIDRGSLLKFVLPMPMQMNIESSVKASVGEMVKEAFARYKPFVNAANTINKSFQVMFRLFKARLDSAIEYRQSQTGTLLTESEINGIINVLKDSMPAVKTALAEGLDDRLIIMNEGTAVVEASEGKDISGQTRFRYAKNIAEKINGKEIASLEEQLKTAGKGPQYNSISDRIATLKNASFSSQAKQFILVEAMAAGAVIPIHFVDGVLMAATLEQTNGMGNHDAVYESPTKVDDTSSTYDKTMAEVMESYSLTVEIANSLVSAIDAAEPGDIKKVNTQFMQDATRPDKADDVESLYMSMRYLASNSEKKRALILSNPIRYDHLANEGGHSDWNMEGVEYTPKIPNTVKYEFTSDDKADVQSVQFAIGREFKVMYPKKSPGKMQNKEVTSIMKMANTYFVQTADFEHAIIIDGNTGLTKAGGMWVDPKALEAAMNDQSLSRVEDVLSNNSESKSSSNVAIKNQTTATPTGKFDTELDAKLRKILKELYPDINLEYTTEEIQYIDANGNVMNQEEVNNTVKVGLKVVEALNDFGTAKPAKHGGTSQPVLSTIRVKQEAGIRRKLAARDVSKEQIDFVFEYMRQNDMGEISSKALAELVLLGLGTGVTVSTSKKKGIDDSTFINRVNELEFLQESDPSIPREFFDKEFKELDKKAHTLNPTSYYADLTVPGGTNYKEMEIATPSIVAPKKGHADFATDKGIGWYRVDDETVGSIENALPNKFVDNESTVWEKKEGVWILTYPDGDVMVRDDLSDSEARITYYKNVDKVAKEGKPTKTLRVLEMQSDMFQKMKANNLAENNGNVFPRFSVIKAKINSIDTKEAREDGENYRKAHKVFIGLDSTESEIESAISTLREFDSKYNVGIKLAGDKQLHKTFLQILNTDNKWVKFFIQSIVQDATKKGYTKIKFPAGETAAKVEGHESIAEQIKALDEDIKKAKSGETIPSSFSYGGPGIMVPQGRKNVAELEIEKQNLKTQGIEKLAPIEGFYQVRVRNTLIKTYGKDNVTTTKDEHGNEWFEVSLDAKRDTSTIMLQKNTSNKIKGQADIEAKTVLINSLLQSQDTLPHEYAHHYIAMFRDTDIVQEGIKKWGSEEKLVQAIGEQVVEQKGEAYSWWKEFTAWLQGKFNNLSAKSKEELRDLLTDSFLTAQDLEEEYTSPVDTATDSATITPIEVKGVSDSFIAAEVAKTTNKINKCK